MITNKKREFEKVKSNIKMKFKKNFEKMKIKSMVENNLINFLSTLENNLINFSSVQWTGKNKNIFSSVLKGDKFNLFSLCNGYKHLNISSYSINYKKRW